MSLLCKFEKKNILFDSESEPVAEDWLHFLHFLLERWVL